MTEAPRADLTKVPEEIASMFDSVATRYDMMDTLMTGGLNHVWMTALRKAVAPHPGERILDLAAPARRPLRLHRAVPRSLPATCPKA